LNFDRRFYAVNAVTGEKTNEGQEECCHIGGLLDAECFATVPVKIRNETVGRIFLTARRRTFDDSDTSFLFQLMEQIVPTVEIIRLVDRLASDAAETERQRIARDIHDSVIQPYIGIQLGLAAIRQKLDLGGFDVMSDVKNLIEISGTEINGLRNYMSGLRSVHSRDGSLVPAVERFAAKFSEAAGIHVQVETASDGIHVNDRLAAEAFQMVAEGLSNIRRHTEATRASISLAHLDDRFLLSIANDAPNNVASAPFVPRSITERARALGGGASVKCEDGETIVRVEIPL
jgi:signal transduction histidine kinase